jgi:hypothetical protein
MTSMVAETTRGPDLTEIHEYAVATLEAQETADWNAKARDRRIRDAWAKGAQTADLVKATGLTRQRIYQITHPGQSAEEIATKWAGQ